MLGKETMRKVSQRPSQLELTEVIKSCCWLCEEDEPIFSEGLREQSKAEGYA